MLNNKYIFRLILILVNNIFILIQVKLIFLKLDKLIYLILVYEIIIT